MKTLKIALMTLTLATVFSASAVQAHCWMHNGVKKCSHSMCKKGHHRVCHWVNHVKHCRCVKS